MHHTNCRRPNSERLTIYHEGKGAHRGTWLKRSSHHRLAANPTDKGSELEKAPCQLYCTCFRLLPLKPTYLLIVKLCTHKPGPVQCRQVAELVREDPEDGCEPAAPARTCRAEVIYHWYDLSRNSRETFFYLILSSQTRTQLLHCLLPSLCSVFYTCCYHCQKTPLPGA